MSHSWLSRANALATFAGTVLAVVCLAVTATGAADGAPRCAPAASTARCRGLRLARSLLPSRLKGSLVPSLPVTDYFHKSQPVLSCEFVGTEGLQKEFGHDRVRARPPPPPPLLLLSALRRRPPSLPVLLLPPRCCCRRVCACRGNNGAALISMHSSLGTPRLNLVSSPPCLPLLSPLHRACIMPTPPARSLPLSLLSWSPHPRPPLPARRRCRRPTSCSTSPPTCAASSAGTPSSWWVAKGRAPVRAHQAHVLPALESRRATGAVGGACRGSGAFGTRASGRRLPA